MALQFRQTDMKKHNTQRDEEVAFRSAVSLIFTQQAEAGIFPSEAIAAHASLIAVWDADAPLTVGCIRRCPDSDALFRCIEPPNPRARTVPKPPSLDAAGWEPVMVATKI